MIVGKRSLKLVWHALQAITREKMEKNSKEIAWVDADARDWCSKQLREAPEGKETWSIDLPKDFQNPFAEALTRIRVMQTAAEMLGELDKYEEDVEQAWKTHLIRREAHGREN